MENISNGIIPAVVVFIRLRNIPVLKYRAVLFTWTVEPSVKKSKQGSRVWVLPYLQLCLAMWIGCEAFFLFFAGCALLMHGTSFLVGWFIKRFPLSWANIICIILSHRLLDLTHSLRGVFCPYSLFIIHCYFESYAVLEISRTISTDNFCSDLK